MRFIEAHDVNENPIFEGDELSLTIKDKFFGGSYFGKFCDFYDVDEAHIRILENGNFLQIKYAITFYRNDEPAVTNQENAYWEYYDNLDKNSDASEKTLEDFSDVEGALELYKLESEASLFFRYLLSKGVEKISGFDGEPTIVPEENLLIKSKLDEDIHIGDKIIVELNDEWKEKLSKDPLSNHCVIEGFTHVLFEFGKREGQFNYYANVYLTDHLSNCKVFKKVLNQEGEKKRSEISSKIFKLKDDDPLIKDYQTEVSNLYENKDFTDLEEYKLFLGLSNEINLLNHFKTKELRLHKVL